MLEQQFKKLPKYAQDEIRQLQRELKNTNAKLLAVTGQADDSTVVYDPFGACLQMPEANVDFNLDERRGFEVWLDIENEILKVSTSDSNGIVLYPRGGANVIDIGLRGR